MTIADITLMAFIVGQATTTTTPETSSLVQTFLTAGVAGAVIIGAIFGFIFFRPERTQLLATLEDLRETSNKYVEIHHTTTLPTLTKALTMFETVVATLTALTKAWDDQARTNAEVGRRLEAIERRLQALDRGPP